MTQDEARAYSKGYSAGKRKADRTRYTEAQRRAKERAWWQVYCAAMQGLLVNATWSTGDKRWSKMSDYARGAGLMADEAIKQHGWRV